MSDSKNWWVCPKCLQRTPFPFPDCTFCGHAPELVEPTVKDPRALVGQRRREMDRSVFDCHPGQDLGREGRMAEQE